MNLLKKTISILPRNVITFLVKIKTFNYCYFFRLVPLRKKKIVFSNFFGNRYGDSPKYIAEKLLEKNIDCEMVWLVKKTLIGNTLFPDRIRTAVYGSFQSLYELATAAVWVDNSRKALIPPKRKGQFYIQTWHSPLRLKKIEKDAEKHLSETYIERAKLDSACCDLMISGNDFSFGIYRNSFWYYGEILKCGTPRCDIFFTDTSLIREKIDRFFRTKPDERFILYAPTFRNTSNLEVFVPDFKVIADAAEKKWGGKWRVLIRFHPKTDVASIAADYGEVAVNASGYDDMQELLAASELLITDYSSSMFDMLIAKKICFIHAPDIDEYTKNERELYFPPERLPFYVSHDTEGLSRNIMNFDPEDYSEKVRNFTELVNVYERGAASEAVAERIREWINR